MMEENGLPKGWVETTLGEVAKTNLYSINKSFAYKTILYLDTGSITKGKIDTLQHYDLKDAPSRAKRLVNKNDIVYSTVRPNLEHYGFISYPKENMVVSTGFTVITAEAINPKFLYYFLTQQNITEYLHSIAEQSVSTYPSIKAEDLETIEFVAPIFLPEQKAIATILTTFDDKIELLQAQNETLENIAQTIFKEWFGKYQVGDELPDGWRVGKLGDVVNLFDSQRIPLSKSQREERKGSYRYYGATNIMDYIDDYIFDGIYLLFAEDGSVIDENGNPVLQYVWGKFWVNNHAHIIQGTNGLSTELLYVFCKNMRVESIINGAVQLKINQRNLLGFDIVIPKKEFLLKLDNLIQPLFEKVRKNNQQIQTLQATRDTLLPKLMSGQLRVEGFKD